MTARPQGMAGRLLAMAMLTAALIAPGSSAAQTCGTDYVLKEGETLADIARKVYGSATQWSVIFYANQDRLGENASLLVPGLSIKIPCIGAQQGGSATPAAVDTTATPGEGASDFELSTMVRRVEFLTAEGYAPFTGRALPEGGLLVDLLQASMALIKEQAKGAFDFQVSWVNDWAAHLNPLLITRAFDAGVPWTRPDCRNEGALDRVSLYKCQKFFFSDPFYESVTVLFVRNDSAFNFERDEQILGRTLCRPRGWSSYDLDKGGRNWVKDDKITLIQPQTAEECFRLLDEGTVDAVVIAELTGRAVAAAMGMVDRVHATSRPLNIETMHVIITKTHPHARTILYYVNGSLAKLKETGAYDAIVAKHLDLFWNSMAAETGQPSAPRAIEPAPPPQPPAKPERTAPETTAPETGNGSRKTAGP